MTREEAAAALAKAMGWEFVGREEYADGEQLGYFGQFEWFRSAAELAAAEDDDEIEALGIPPADAPLHEHLSFVGRIVEALGTNVRVEWNRCTAPAFRSTVVLAYNFPADAFDPSHAAMLAAIKVKAPK